MNKSILLVTTALGAVISAFAPAVAQINGGAPVGGQQGIGAAPPETITITAQQLSAARNTIETDIGASTFNFSEVQIQSLPGGDNTLLNQVILQAPDVAQDLFGQFHVRGEHAELQYRIDGIILPEGISVFGQTLSPRLIDSMRLVTGALPAEYGLRNAGIIDITTKSGALDTGGDMSIYGGSHSTYNPSIEYGGSSGNLSYFVSGDYLHDLLGIESPDGSSTPHHDKTNQYHGFAMLEDFLDPNDRVAVMMGTSHDNFQIPNTPGLTPQLGLTVNGQTDYPSLNLNETQSEITHFGIVSFQHSQDLFDVQTSLTARYSSLSFTPDQLGDLLYNGIAQTAFKSNLAYAWQTDSAFHVIRDHTIRAGFYLQDDRGISKTSSQVLPVDANGVQTTDVPEAIIDNSSKVEKIYSFYLQDEWKIFETFTLNYGFRYDEVQAFTAGSMIEPRVNAVWQPFTGTTLHAGYAKYLTPPPFEQINNESVGKFVNTTAAPSVTQDDTPVVERANYFDVGASQIVIPGLTVGLDSYAKFDHDLIDEGQFGAPIILTPFNYKDGRQYGAELTTNYTVENFSAYANFSVQHAIGKDIVTSQFNFSQDDLNYIATHYIDLDHEQHFTASGGMSWLYDGTRISADIIVGSGLRANLTLPDGSSIPNGAHLPYYTQTNLGLQHSFDIAGGLIARFDVINVFDIKYQIRNGTGVGVGAPQWGPRRGFFFGLEKTF